MNRCKTLSIILILFITVSSVGCSNKNATKSGIKSNNIPTAEKTLKDDGASKEVLNPLTNNPDSTLKTPNSTVQTYSNTPSTSNSSNAPSTASPPIAPITPPTFDKAICIGTTEAEVRQMSNGYGNFADYGLVHEYTYKTSQIYFANVGGTFKVIGWRNINKTFKFSVGEVISSAPPITLGSTKEQVASCAGAPEYYEIPYAQDADSPRFIAQPNRDINWSYSDGSSITFNSSFKVIAWYNKGSLRINYGKKIDSAPLITLGVSTQDILNALGTPTFLTKWYAEDSQKYIGYQNCTLNLDIAGNVDGWTNYGCVKINLGDKDPSAQPFSNGSSKENVIKAMGTPEKVVRNYCWYYGNSIVYFNTDWTVRQYTNTGNLKVK